MLSALDSNIGSTTGATSELAGTYASISKNVRTLLFTRKQVDEVACFEPCFYHHFLHGLRALRCTRCTLEHDSIAQNEWW